MAWFVFNVCDGVGYWGDVKVEASDAAKAKDSACKYAEQEAVYPELLGRPYCVCPADDCDHLACLKTGGPP